ncbi:hypothetical protein OsJ_28973 [Oryza sativa Japonica Group]|uniref:Uncharacterized protein n=1 Tax=Oryza sativa subsp. japonica TaxID=39947 RepID=A3BXR1_ORYSJ|nr:hypothetical protein OsJ_28973 [Oryza sativa Japonica Group]
MPGTILGLVAAATILGAAFAVAATPPTPPPQAPAMAPAPRRVQVQAPWMDCGGDTRRRAVLPPTGDGVATGTVRRRSAITFTSSELLPRSRAAGVSGIGTLTTRTG